MKNNAFKFKDLFLVSLFIFTIFIPFRSLSFAQGREELLFQQIPTVVTPAKRKQPLTEAASTVMIITAEDIRQSGAASLADVLRQASGLDVVEPAVGNHQLGIRGFPDGKHVLVNLDGNNIYIYHANLVFWDALPLSLEEIDRIEIIKGPGAIFHGGNAFSGVINIITKTPEQLKGIQGNFTGGEYDTYQGNIIQAWTFENWSYSLNYGRREAERWESGLKDAETELFGGKLIYNLDDESSLSLMARFSDTDRSFFSSLGGAMYQPGNRYLGMRYDRPDFWVRAFWNHHYKPGQLAPGGVPASTALTNFDDDSYEAEFMRTLQWSDNTTSVGGYIKRSELETIVENTSEDECHTEQWAANLENQYRATDELLLSLGGRFEHHSVVGNLGMGRGSIIYTPIKKHTFRLTAASGYFIPSLLATSVNIVGAPLFSNLTLLGNSDIKEEQIYSGELAYYGFLTDKLKLNANLFYNKIKDYVYVLGSVSLPTMSMTSVNGTDIEQWGGEIGTDILFADWLTGFANYAYDYTDRDDHGDLEVHPRHKVNLGLRAKFRDKIFANLTAHYVDERYFVDAIGAPLAAPQKTDGYFTVHTRLAYRALDNLEFAVAAYNLFKDEHREGVDGDKIGRRITGSVNFKF